MKPIALLLVAFYGGCTLPPLPQANTFTLRGTSMEPTIRDGSQIAIRRVPFESLAVGDVVCYRNLWHKENPTLTHRIVRKTAAGWITKGDGNSHEDVGLVTKSNFVGILKP